MTGIGKAGIAVTEPYFFGFMESSFSNDLTIVPMLTSLLLLKLQVQRIPRSPESPIAYNVEKVRFLGPRYD